MPRWLHGYKAWGLTRPSRLETRLFGSRHYTEFVRVPCASSGDITVSLHNVSHHHPTTPLVIFIPPFSQPGPEPAVPLPACLLHHPTAIINYRWRPHTEDERPDVHLQWPTPLHDVLFGYSWLSSKLGLTDGTSPGPRSAYVYGSYLGASLAASLALTESHLPHPSRPMTVRGLIAHNGIYNWTMFLPDHPIHKLSRARRRKGLVFPLPVSNTLSEDEADDDDIFALLKRQTTFLFSDPAQLFDPFASPCLFFHSPNLHVPQDFTTPLTENSSLLPPEWTQAIDALSSSSSSFSISTEPSSPDSPSHSDPESAAALLARAEHQAKQLRPPRKGYLVFPPRYSTLRLPETLLLYNDDDDHVSGGSKTRISASTSTRSGARNNAPSAARRRQQKSRNSFRVQANELAGLMRRSLRLLEFRERTVGDDNDEDYEAVVDLEDARTREAERRVQIRELRRLQQAGVETGAAVPGLDQDGEERVADWLRERIDEEGRLVS